MKGHAKTARQIAAVLFVTAGLGFAQTNSLSAPAPPAAAPAAVNAAPGSINYVEGTASLDGQVLSPQSVGSVGMKPGQIVNTGEGYVEVLLTPGAFLRIGHNSAVRLTTAGLANSQVQLERGASMLEVDQLIKGTQLTVSANGARTRIDKTGLYSFDANQQSVKVLDGKASVTFDDHSQTLGKHDQVLLASDKPLKKRSFDGDASKSDPLYVWSRARSEDESQASFQAANEPTYYAAAGPGWFWDPYYMSYGFWPVGGPLYSPFGWGFYSPAYFGFYGGYYGGGFYPGYYRHGYWHGRVGGVNARAGSFHRSSGAAGNVGFRGSAGGGSGFHGSAGGGFHGGGGGHR